MTGGLVRRWLVLPSVWLALSSGACSCESAAKPSLVTTVPAGAQTTESGMQATFTVQLDRRPSRDVVFAVATSDATEGTTATTSVVFTRDNWNAPQEIVVTGVDDDVADTTQAYEIVLGPSVSADTAFTGLTAQVTLANVDDESPGITVTPALADVSESGTTTTFTVVLHSEPTADVVLSLASDDEGEGSLSTGSLTFTSENWNAPQTVTVTGVDDDLIDGTQAFHVGITAVSSTDSGYGTLAPPAAITVSNTDDDSAGIVVVATDDASGEDGSTATFTLALAAAPDADVTLTLVSTDTGEGDLTSSTTLVFTAASYAVPQIVTVTGDDDDVADGDQPYAITVSASTSLDTRYAALADVTVPLSNEDDDTAGIDVSAASSHTGEDATQATFTVVLSSEPLADVTITFDTDDAGEGTLDLTTLTFTADDWDQPQTVTVTGQDDDLDDGDQPYQVVFADVTSADPAYDLAPPANVVLTNDDDDDAGISVSAADGHTAEDGTAATFTVVLTSEPTADVVVTFDTDDASEGVPNVTTLTFTSGDWDQPQSVTVAGQEDDIDDGDVAYQIDFADVASTDANYAALLPSSVALVNDDDDTAGFGVSAISGNTTEKLASATFTVVLLAEPTANVVLTFGSDDASEGLTNITTLTFTSDDWDQPQTVTVTGVDDSIVDGNIAYDIVFDPAESADPAYDGLVPDSVEVTNIDDRELCSCPYGGDDFEDGLAQGFTNLGQTLAVTNADGANGTSQSITVTGGVTDHVNGVVYQAPACLTTRFSVWLKPSAGSAAHNYVVLGDDSVTATNAILFLYAQGSSGKFRLVSSSTAELPLTPDVWIQFVAEIDWATHTLDATLGGVSLAQDFPFRNTNINQLTRIHFYNFNSAVGRYDQLELQTACP